jgi:hypothetical protein
MFYEKRISKSGQQRYSFVWYDTKLKKRVRLSQQEITNRFGKEIKSEDEAKECIRLLEAHFHLETYHIKKRLAWENEFYNFNSLLDQYLLIQKKKAPNSWKNNEFYLKHYVLPYFLSIKKLNNIELWSSYFDEYKDWLESKPESVDIVSQTYLF